MSDSRATTVVKKLPVEIVSMYNLRSRIGANSVVGIRNFRLDTPNKMHRLYLEYCSNGDLWELIQSYHRKRTLSRDVGPGLEGPECIPEPFIWHTFECLATAGLLLECGELNADPISAWDLVVHRDFKLANVFLGSNLLDRFRGYAETLSVQKTVTDTLSDGQRRSLVTLALRQSYQRLTEGSPRSFTEQALLVTALPSK